MSNVLQCLSLEQMEKKCDKFSLWIAFQGHCRHYEKKGMECSHHN